MIIGIVVAFAVFASATNNQKKSHDISQHKWQMGDSLNHEDCANETTSCLHDENGKSEQECPKCGFKNESTATKCAVCGRKLWKL